MDSDLGKGCHATVVHYNWSTVIHLSSLDYKCCPLKLQIWRCTTQNATLQNGTRKQLFFSLAPSHFQVLDPADTASLQGSLRDVCICIEISLFSPCLLICMDQAELWIWLIPSEKQRGQCLDLSCLGPAPCTGWDDLVQLVAKGKGQNDNCLPAGI